jgi:hypothetical protein
VPTYHCFVQPADFRRQFQITRKPEYTTSRVICGMKCDIPMMGEAAIEATFGDVRTIPMRDYESVYCMSAIAEEGKANRTKIKQRYAPVRLHVPPDTLERVRNSQLFTQG